MEDRNQQGMYDAKDYEQKIGEPVVVRVKKAGNRIKGGMLMHNIINEFALLRVKN